MPRIAGCLSASREAQPHSSLYNRRVGRRGFVGMRERFACCCRAQRRCGISTHQSTPSRNAVSISSLYDIHQLPRTHCAPPEGSCLAEASVPETLLVPEVERLLLTGDVKRLFHRNRVLSIIGSPFHPGLLLQGRQRSTTIRYVVFRFRKTLYLSPNTAASQHNREANIIRNYVCTHIIATTARSIASRRYTLAKASISIAPRWPDGSAHPASCSHLWSMLCASMFWAAVRFMPTYTPVPVLAPGNGDQGWQALTYVRDERPAGENTAQPCGFAYTPDARESDQDNI